MAFFKRVSVCSNAPPQQCSPSGWTLVEISTPRSLMTYGCRYGPNSRSGFTMALGTYSNRPVTVYAVRSILENNAIRIILLSTLDICLAPPTSTRLASPVVPVVHACSALFRSTGSLGVSRFLVDDHSWRRKLRRLDKQHRTAA